MKPPPTVYVGVDHGARGAYAAIWPDGRVEVYRLPTPIVDRVAAFEAVLKAARMSAFHVDATIEKPQAYPIDRVSGKTGKGITINAQLAIMLRMGIGFGETVASIEAAGIPTPHRVLPQTWKATVCSGIGVGGKAKSIAAATALYGDAVNLTPPRARKPDDNFADAVLIARYGQVMGQVPF